MRFKSFTLDPFQEDSVKAIEKNKSVVVSAATGTGKTLIADYVIDKYIKKGKRIIYTAPIKALSNQKFKDFKNDYGWENVGILTGDLVINSAAPLLIMTTEIYRNMLLVNDPLLDEVSYVVFDEIHYMNDPERGTVWEESIIFSPLHIRFLFLSATIPNARDFGNWISSIKEHDVEVVTFSKRAVPLDNLVYESASKLTSAKELKELYDLPKYPRGRRSKRRHNKDYKVASPQEVILEMHDKLPAIVFSFSRKACEEQSIKTIKDHDFVENATDRQTIVETYRRKFTPEINKMSTTHKLKECLLKGVGFHHAGLLPQLKEVVEDLFGMGLLKVLYATETFSVGINMPAKTVIFNGLRKYDGRSFRMLNSKEYFQLAGRAGRRGLDEVGYAVAIIDRREINLDDFIAISSEDKDPIRSQFQLSVNTVLNLIANHSDEEIRTILQSNFDYFMRKKQSSRQVRVMASFNNKKRLLTRRGYVKGHELTEKGRFTRFIYFEELLISELFTTKMYKKFTDTEILQLIASIIYEPRQSDRFSFKGVDKDYAKLLKKVQKNEYVAKNMSKLSLKRMMAIVKAWSENGTFEDLLYLTSYAEGDVIRLFRRIIDMLGQIIRATADYELRQRLQTCIKRIDRDLIAVQL